MMLLLLLLWMKWIFKLEEAMMLSVKGELREQVQDDALSLGLRKAQSCSHPQLD